MPAAPIESSKLMIRLSPPSKKIISWYVGPRRRGRTGANGPNAYMRVMKSGFTGYPAVTATPRRGPTVASSVMMDMSR